MPATRRSEASPEAVYSDTLELDLATVQPSLAGPKRPQDRVVLPEVKDSFVQALPGLRGDVPADKVQKIAGMDAELRHGDVVIAAITSCTNTSNPDVMVGAGLVARKARALGLNRKPWVKTSLAPGSKVVTDYLNQAGLMDDLEALGFYLGSWRRGG
mgnify:CR=1 FL=1